MIVETWLENDLKKPILVEKMAGNLFSGDNDGNLIGVVVTDDGEPAELTGACTGYFIRPDGATVLLNGEVNDNIVSIVLPASCYIYCGQFSLVIKVDTVTVGACVGRIYRTRTDEIIDPGDVVPSVEELMALINNECFIIETGTITSFPKTITDSRIDETCIVLDEIPDDNVDIGWLTMEGKIVLYGSLPSGTTLASRPLKVHRCYGITNEAMAITVRMFESNAGNGNYLVADATGLTPGVQYSWRLYSVSGSTETYVYGIGAIAYYPAVTRWFNENTCNLVDGTTYLCKICPTTDSSNVATSGTVTFVGGGVTPDPEEETDSEEETEG